MARMHVPDHVAREDLLRANQRFYEAFERLDFEAMCALWLDDPSIRCVHPGSEALVGPGEVHASWRAIFASTDSIHIDVADVAPELNGTTGVIGCVERLYDDDHPRVVDSVIAATNVFVRRGGRWYMTVHHASPIARRFLGG
jgi:ketosteroid isomerase-like protein